jgi:Paraquat-inducible protein A
MFTNVSYSSNEEICAQQQMNISLENDITELHVAYELKFFSAVQRAWTSNAKLLGIIVVLFSGLWPYLKNIIMSYIWYCTPTNHNTNHANHEATIFRRRHLLIVWLKRLGKWSLVDVYIIILLMIGLSLQINVGNDQSIPLILKGEPRAAIISFLIATIFSFIHLEILNEYHIHQYHTYCHNHNNKLQQQPLPPSQEPTNDESMINPTNYENTIVYTSLYDALKIYPIYCSNRTTDMTKNVIRFRSPIIGRLLLCILFSISIALLIIGSIVDVVHFTSYTSDSDTNNSNNAGCIHAYNLYTLGTMLVSNFFLYDNSALPGVYTLFIAYLLFIIVCHVVVHMIHFITLWINLPQQKIVCRVADFCWTFASIEVLLLGIFTVQVCSE